MNVRRHREFLSDFVYEMKEVYQSVGWVKHTKEVIQQIYEASNVISIAVLKGQIVGFGRGLTDGVFNAAIYDVVVHKDFQKQGIANVIMEGLFYQLRDVSCVHLKSTTGDEAFYQKWRLKKVKTGMAKYSDPVLSKQYLETI